MSRLDFLLAVFGCRLGIPPDRGQFYMLYNKFHPQNISLPRYEATEVACTKEKKKKETPL